LGEKRRDYTTPFLMILLETNVEEKPNNWLLDFIEYILEGVKPQDIIKLYIDEAN
jgi:hypothetical protein